MKEIATLLPPDLLTDALRNLYERGIPLTPDLVDDESIKEILETVLPLDYCADRYRRMTLMSLVSTDLGFKKTTEGIWRDPQDFTERELDAKWTQLNVKQQRQETKYGIQKQEIEEIAEAKQLDLFGDSTGTLSYDSKAEKAFAKLAIREGFEIEHNSPVKNESGRYYKLDYAILKDGKRTRFSVEIMSETYHKYQLAEDYDRLRELNGKGLFVMLFTANTIYGRPAKTAKQIKRILSTWGKLCDIMR